LLSIFFKNRFGKIFSIWIFYASYKEDIVVLTVLGNEEQQVIGPEAPPSDTYHVPNHKPSLLWSL